MTDITGTMADITGTVKLAPEVLATIVNLTTVAVPGVVAMGTVPGHGFPLRPRHDTTRGVRLGVRQNTVTVDLYVIVAQGINMVGAGAAIQRAVTDAVHEMLGMDVKDVNIYIQNIE